LTRVLRRFEADQTVSITVVRNGQKVYLEITLDEKPVAQEDSEQQDNNSNNNNNYFGQLPNGWQDFLSPFFGIG